MTAAGTYVCTTDKPKKEQPSFTQQGKMALTCRPLLKLLSASQHSPEPAVAPPTRCLQDNTDLKKKKRGKSTFRIETTPETGD